jgi:putative ABC transport system permease protein
VFGGFAGVAVIIAVVGVAGVLAFTVSGRTRELGIRLALGSKPQSLLMGIVAEGITMAAAGLVSGAVLGYVLERFASSYFGELQSPSPAPVVASAIILLLAAVVASALPAHRASRIDVVEALRAE